MSLRTFDLFHCSTQFWDSDHVNENINVQQPISDELSVTDQTDFESNQRPESNRRPVPAPDLFYNLNNIQTINFKFLMICMIRTRL